MIYLLDTCTLTRFYEGDSVVENMLAVPFPSLFISPVTIQEFLSGPIDGIKNNTNAPYERISSAYQKLIRYVIEISKYNVLDDTEAANNYFKQLTTQASRVSANDRRIAAIALAHNAVVVTFNTRDFDKLLPPSRLQDWSRPDKGVAP